MAESRYRMTGLLKLGKITPVIEALFGIFNVEKYASEAFIYQDGQSVGYEALADRIRAHLDLGGVDDIKDLFIAMGKLFGMESEVTAFLGDDEISECDEDVDPSFLFDLACLVDDGHGLQSISTSGAWTCNKMAPREFGGDGYFASKNSHVYLTSNMAESLGERIDSALAENNLDAVTDVIAEHAERLLRGIHDEALRARVTELLAERLSPQPVLFDQP